MRLLAAGLAQALHMALMLAAAPLLLGLLRLATARLRGAAGPPLLQPWRDLLRLARKQPVMAENASFVSTAAPAVCFAASAAAASLVPSFALGMLLAPFSDLLVLAGLLGLARAALALAALDVGTAFGGIGASRAMAGAAFAEPALLLVILVLTVLAGTSNLNAIATMLHEEAGVRLPLALALVAVLCVGLVTNGLGPAGDPDLGEAALATEFSGRHLALLEWSAALRLLLWFSLIAAIWLPFGAAPPGADPLRWLVGLPAWGAKVLVLALGLAGLQAGMTKGAIIPLGLRRVPRLLGLAGLLALLAAVFLFLGQGRV